MAVSKEKACSNIKFQAKNRLKLNPNTPIEIDITKIKEENNHEKQQKQQNQQKHPNLKK